MGSHYTDHCHKCFVTINPSENYYACDRPDCAQRKLYADMLADSERYAKEKEILARKKAAQAKRAAKKLAERNRDIKGIKRHFKADGKLNREEVGLLLKEIDRLKRL